MIDFRCLSSSIHAVWWIIFFSKFICFQTKRAAWRINHVTCVCLVFPSQKVEGLKKLLFIIDRYKIWNQHHYPVSLFSCIFKTFIKKDMSALIKIVFILYYFPVIIISLNFLSLCLNFTLDIIVITNSR